MKITGVLLIAIGLVLTAFTAVKFFTKEKVVSLGELEITAQKPHYLSWSPIIGIAIVSIGAFIFWKSLNK
jgi:hypothetical protein